MTPTRIDRMQRDVEVNQPGKLMAISFIAGLAVMFLAMTSMTSPDLSAGQNAGAAQAAASPGTETVYFPSQYTNQATGSAEHTESF